MPEIFDTALALARAYADGRANPVDVTTAAIERAAGVPAAFISTTPERALAEAASSAARWKRGTPLSPLDGVPIAWKDLFDVAGSVTTAGSAVYATHAPAVSDAPLVAAAASAGLIGIGKTNLSEFAYSGLGLNPHFGTPVNRAVDNGSRVPGGSSSGAAIAVAAGVAPIAIGTDTGGSIRIPSAFNGLVGYRASTSRYSRTGMTALSATLDTVGPIARSVADCAAFDATVRGAAMPNALPDLNGCRFVVDPALLARYAVSDAVGANLQRFVEQLRDAGADVQARAVATLEQVHELIRVQGWLGALEAFQIHRALLDSSAADRIDQRVRTRLEASRHVPAGRLGQLLDSRTALIGAFQKELGDATLIAPTVAHVAPELAPLQADPERFAGVNLKTLALTMPGSFLDTPAIALPSGADARGLPTGVQLMRARNDDDALLAIALCVEHQLL